MLLLDVRDYNFTLFQTYFTLCKMGREEEEPMRLHLWWRRTSRDAACDLISCSGLFGWIRGIWYLVGLCQFRFQNNRNSDSLAIFGIFSGIDSGIVDKKNRKTN